MRGILPTKFELVIEASTRVSTMAQKPLATAAINRKADRGEPGNEASYLLHVIVRITWTRGRVKNISTDKKAF